MDKFVLIPQEQFIICRKKGTSEVEKVVASNTKQSSNINTPKQEEKFKQDTHILVGGSDKLLPPPGIRNKKRERNIVFKKTKSSSRKSIWQKL